MFYQNLHQAMIKISLILLLLTACSAPTETVLPPTEIPPTPTPLSPTDVPPTEVPPTPTALPPTELPPSATPVPPTEIPPTETPVWLENVDLLYGNWKPLSTHRDAMYLQINSDGTCRQSPTLEGLLNNPKVECTYIFDGKDLSMTVVKLNNLPECPTPTGTYEVHLIKFNQIQLVVSEDTCSPRRNSTQGEYQYIP